MTDASRSPADDHEAGRQRRLPIDPDAGFPTMSRLDFVRLRERVGTQHEAAVEMQTARRTLGRWERGDRPIPGVAAVCIRLLAEEADRRRARTEAAVAEIVAERS